MSWFDISIYSDDKYKSRISSWRSSGSAPYYLGEPLDSHSCGGYPDRHQYKVKAIRNVDKKYFCKDDKPMWLSTDMLPKDLLKKLESFSDDDVIYLEAWDSS